MSTGLAALSQGDMSKLASELVLAFTTTVVGLAIGTSSYFLYWKKRRWIEQDIRRMEFLTEILVENYKKESTRAVRYMKRHLLAVEEDFGDDDPLAGVANLFDLSVVFIVGLIVTIFSAFQLLDLFNEKSDMTLIKKNFIGKIFKSSPKKAKRLRQWK